MSYSSRPARGGSKATVSTVCQKCLQRGHYSYECKAGAQERPYQSRPSRSQQLLNPRLRPQLQDTAPDPETTKKGIADDILAKKTASRGRKRSFDELDDRPRRRSASATSRSSSVSTISAAASRSPPHKATSFASSHVREPAIHHNGDGTGKRRRRTSSVSPGRSEPNGANGTWTDKRNIRSRKRSVSPAARGRKSLRSPTKREDGYGDRAKRRERSADMRDRDGESRLSAQKGDRMDEYQGSTRIIDTLQRRSPSPYSKRLALSSRGAG